MGLQNTIESLTTQGSLSEYVSSATRTYCALGRLDYELGKVKVTRCRGKPAGTDAGFLRTPGTALPRLSGLWIH